MTTIYAAGYFSIIILAPFISSSDQERFSHENEETPGPETLRESRLGTVGMVFNINKKSCRKRLLTYLARYRINYICGVSVVYPETVTNHFYWK